VRAGAAGDKATLRSAAEALVAEERAKNHNILAERLEKALQAISVSPQPLTTNVQIGHASGRDLILESNPTIQLEDLVLPLPARREADQLIEEHVRADLLRAHGYEPRHRVLLSGPPGNGKTSYAEGVAQALSLPFFVVRYDALIGSYLGETNTRLRALFDYVRMRPCVLFFDEFDAIGKERGDVHETGEIKRVVSFLLMQIDHLPSYVLTVAATNHAELLDRAVWRRFQSRIALPAPGPKEVAAYLEKVISSWPVRPAKSVDSIAACLGASSYAEVRDFCQNVRRRHILGLSEATVDAAMAAELALWAERVRPDKLDAQRSNKAIAPAKRRNRRRKTPRKTRSAAKTRAVR
jgi:AAA+ superfamily predicted ATPase